MSDNCRLRRNHIETTAHESRKYKGGGRGNIKCISYYFSVGNEWYDGSTSPPDSVWDNLQLHDPFVIVYEKGNPKNSNWAGYFKK